MAAKSRKAELLPEIIRLNRDEGMTVAAASARLGVHPVTVCRWMRDEGVEPVKIRTGRFPQPDRHVTYVCDQCGKRGDTLRSRSRRFCSRECTNAWQRRPGSPVPHAPSQRPVHLERRPYVPSPLAPRPVPIPDPVVFEPIPEPVVPEPPARPWTPLFDQIRAEIRTLGPNLKS